MHVCLSAFYSIGVFTKWLGVDNKCCKFQTFYNENQLFYFKVLMINFVFHIVPRKTLKLDKTINFSVQLFIDSTRLYLFFQFNYKPFKTFLITE